MLAPLTGGADDDEAVETFRTLDPNDEVQVRAVIRSLLTPYIRRFDRESFENAKAALHFSLNSPEIDLGSFFDSNLPPFSAPDHPRLFFVWLWDELFPGESHHLSTVGDFEIEPDINVTWKIKLSPDMTIEKHKELRDLLGFCALEPKQRFQVVEQIAGIRAIPVRNCAGRLIETLGQWCTYRIFDYDNELDSLAEDRLAELHSLTTLMLQSHEDLWSQEAIEGVGAWSLVSRVAREVQQSLGWGVGGFADPQVLAAHIDDI